MLWYTVSMNKHTYTIKLNDEQLLKFKELVVAGLNVAQARGLDAEYTDVFDIIMEQMDWYYANNGVPEQSRG